MATGTDIKKLFNTITDDQTELADSEIILLINKTLKHIGSERDWGMMRKVRIGVLDANSEINVPADFIRLMANYVDDTTRMMSDMVVVYVNNIPYPVIQEDAVMQQDISDSRTAYYDYQASKIKVNSMPGANVKFTYKAKLPELLTLSDDVPLPYEHTDILAYGLAIDDTMIQKIDALKNYLPKNTEIYREYLSKLRIWDSRTFYNI